MTAPIEPEKPRTGVLRGPLKQTAEAVATDLFTNGQGEQADRLVLMKDSTNTTLGGWNKDAVRARVYRLLLRLERRQREP